MIPTRAEYKATLREAAEARQAECAAAGHLPSAPAADRLVDAVPFSIRCDCGCYSWLPVSREVAS